MQDLLAKSELVSHGTTVGTNAIIEGEGTNAALVTTRGAEDVIFIMRAATGRSKGLPVEDVLQFQKSNKPDPIIPKKRVYGINERIDCMGDVVVEFNEEQAREVTSQLAQQDVDAVAINFLWSFLNDGHERRMESIIREELDNDVFVTRASDLIPKWGEYERTTAAAINAFVGPTSASYIQRIDDRLSENGYDGTLLVMQSGGGVVSAEDAVREPIRTINSGPVGGMIGCRFLAEQLGHRNVIAGDIGGTSFDIGLLIDGEPLTKPTNVINQYEYMMRTIDTESIGSGGGSIAFVDNEGDRLRVGPQSTGATPGPACYDQGGNEPTVTDADLLLGFLDEDDFLGGRMTLDRDRSVTVIESIADELRMDTIETASGIIEVMNAKMADMIRQRTVNEGYDPREFVLYAYGGAGPLHVPGLAPQLDINTVVVPGGSTASVWSAVGVSSSDVLHRREVSNIMNAPFDSETITHQFNDLESAVIADLHDEGFTDDDIQTQRYADMRYQAQVHQLSIPLPNGTLTAEDMEAVIARFERTYEDRYGKGAGYSESGFELVTTRVDAYGETTKPAIHGKSGVDELEPWKTKEVYWPSNHAYFDTPRYRDADVGVGATIEGPAIVGMEHTTIGIPPESTCEVDSMSNYIINFGGK
ncbi:hydantoinase/oxoprolinase family protein [Haladaptatus pallidirubidus]|uniref:hydantoinase/oxoprolinase family protein n=1 Tax=Haladaptatus pallidirubidus TaxID=1008152 RepID=UPI0035E67634